MVQHKIFTMLAGNGEAMSSADAASRLFHFTAGPHDRMSELLSRFIGNDSRFDLTADGRIRLTGTGKSFRDLMNSSFVVVDLETTGTRTYKDKITEIAAFRVRSGEVVERFESLVNPGRYITYDITKITGITNEMVQDAPTIEEVMPGFLEFLGEGFFVAHNAPFDHRFVNAALDEMGYGVLPNRVICTVKLSRKIFPGHKRYNLDALATRLGIVNRSRHRAAGDAAATAEVLKAILRTLPQREIFSVEQLLEIC